MTSWPATTPPTATSAKSPNASSATPTKTSSPATRSGLDLFWLRDESLEDIDNLPPPAVLAAEIAEDLQSALTEIQALCDSLAATASHPTADTPNHPVP